MITPADTPKTVKLNILRQDSPDSQPYWQNFEIPCTESSNVTSLLRSISANPVTAQGTKVAPPAYEASCLEEVCGSCTMVINGRVRQACSTLIRKIQAQHPGEPITIEPMTKFPVIRDLVVDRSRMFENLKRIKAWIPIDGTFNLGPGPKITPEEQEIMYPLSRCMTCGSCLEACPQFTRDNAFVGAQIFSIARYYNMHPNGQKDKDARMDVLIGEGGITDCGNAQNCVKVCPKDIPLTESIGVIGRAATVYSIKKFFSK